MNIVTLTPSCKSLGPLIWTALMTLSVRPRKLILTLTFLNSILIHKPKLLLNPSPLRVRRICLLTMQPLATESQLLLKTEPNSLTMMPVNPWMFKRMLKTPPLISKLLLLFFYGIVTILGTAF